MPLVYIPSFKKLSRCKMIHIIIYIYIYIKICKIHNVSSYSKYSVLCRSIYLHRIRVEHYSHDDVVLFLSLDSTTAQKKSITVSYQFQVRGLASGYEFRNACKAFVFHASFRC